MKKLLASVTTFLVFAGLLLLSGCGDAAGAAAGSFLDSLASGNEKQAEALCYDRYSWQQAKGALEDGVRGERAIESAGEPSTTRVRVRGAKVDPAVSAAELMEAPASELDARYKPETDKARQTLADAEAEMAAAEAQLKYAHETYFGAGAAQIAAAQRQVSNARARVERASTAMTALTDAHAAELEAIKASAESGAAADMERWEKEFKADSVEREYVKVKCRVGAGKDKRSVTLTVVNDGGAWKIYSAA